MSLYGDSQDAILKADEYQRAGDKRRARQCYLRAAEAQERMVEELPPEHVRTRAVYTRSAAVLYAKAGRCERAICLLAKAMEWLIKRLPEGE